MRLPHLLDELSAKHKQMGSLLRSLLSSLLGNQDNAEACHKLTQDVIGRVPIAEHAEAGATQLLRALQTAAQEELPGMQQTLRCKMASDLFLSACASTTRAIFFLWSLITSLYSAIP